MNNKRKRKKKEKLKRKKKKQNSEDTTACFVILYIDPMNGVFCTKMWDSKL
jgi:hypothetical protein